MKFFILTLLSFSLVSCATHRDPASIEASEEAEVSRGINSDYYGTR